MPRVLWFGALGDGYVDVQVSMGPLVHLRVYSGGILDYWFG